MIILKFDDRNLQFGTRLGAPQVLEKCSGKVWEYFMKEAVSSLLLELEDMVQCTGWKQLLTTTGENTVVAKYRKLSVNILYITNNVQYTS